MEMKLRSLETFRMLRYEQPKPIHDGEAMKSLGHRQSKRNVLHKMLSVTRRCFFRYQ